MSGAEKAEHNDQFLVNNIIRKRKYVKDGVRNPEDILEDIKNRTIELSRKQKGRKLQNLLRDKLLKAFPHLHQIDLKVGKNGSNGEDLKISRIGRRLIPYQFECKNQEKFKTIYSFWDQTVRHGKHEPVLIVKQNTRRALAVIDLDEFIDLIK